MSDFRERKARRTDLYFRGYYGWRRKKCTACNGSGVYDSFNSPSCQCCNGTGKEWYRGPKAIDAAMAKYP